MPSLIALSRPAVAPPWRWAVVLYFALVAVEGRDVTPAQAVVLGGQSLSLGVDAGLGGVLQLLDKTTGLDWMSGSSTTNWLWQIDLLPAQGLARVLPSMARRFRWEFPPTNGLELRMAWEEFGLPRLKRLRVEVTVALDPVESQSYWSIRIKKPSRLRIEKVRFPRIAELTRQPAERLAVPAWMGQLSKTPRQLIAGRTNKAHRLEWSYPGALSLQCLAFYRENGPGLYLACDDTAAFRKAFAFWGASPRRLGYEMVHYPQNEARARTEYSLPYRAIIGTFSGDWFTAAERYRHWGTNQHWAVRSRLNQGLAPDWLLQTALWVWNRGRSEGVTGPAAALAHDLRLPVSVFWHWWHGCAYDAGFPEYLPPREGTAKFQTAVSAAHQDNLRTLVYLNQRLWGLSTRSWKDRRAKRYAVKALDGKIKSETYNTYTDQACASMCVATPFWRRTCATLGGTIGRELGVDGLYLDQACSSLLCYNPAHGHPVGGGAYWFNGCRLLADDLRHRTRAAKEFLLAGEGVGEAWLPCLDLMLALQVSRERYASPKDGWDCLPFFQAVYHPYGVIFGNYSSLTIPPYDDLWPPKFAPPEPLKLLDRKFSTQFYLEQARTFAWGDQPAIANYLPSQRQERAEEIQYLLRLARVRAQGTKYLLYGTFLRPPAVAAPAITFPVSHLSIYAGRKGKADEKKKPSATENKTGGGPRHEATRAESSSPPLICGAWRAKDGSAAIAIANIIPSVVPFKVDLSPYGCQAGDRLRLINESGATDLGGLNEDRVVTLEVRPRDAVILEISR